MAVLRSAGLALALLCCGAASAQASEPDMSTPTTLFGSVCLSDQVRLPKEAVKAISYAKLPIGARTVLGFSLPPQTSTSVLRLSPVPGAEVPNSILAVLPKKNAYLIVPAPSGAGRVAAHCAVIWRGNHFADAIAAVKAIPTARDLSPMLALNKGIPGTNSVSLKTDGMMIGAAEFQGWTLLRIAPDFSPPEEQPTR